MTNSDGVNDDFTTIASCFFYGLSCLNLSNTDSSVICTVNFLLRQTLDYYTNFAKLEIHQSNNHLEELMKELNSLIGLQGRLPDIEKRAYRQSMAILGLSVPNILIKSLNLGTVIKISQFPNCF